MFMFQGIDSYVASFNTPGSSINRELTLDMELDRNRNDMRIQMRSPWKKFDITGGKTVLTRQTFC